MNSKRKAELQRKLSMTSVPHPPHGLAERIKSDIPNYLQAAPERERLTWSIASTMRVAASILLLITTALVTLRLLEPETRPAAKSVHIEKPVPAVMRGTQSQIAASAQAPASEEVHLEIAQDVPAAPPAVPQTAAARADEASPERRMRQESDAQASSPGGVIGGATGGVAGNVSGRTFVEDAVQETTVVAEAPVVAAPAPPMAELAPAPAPMPTASEPVTVTASAPAAPRPRTSLVREAYADSIALAPGKEVFGISVNPQVFDAIRLAIERGTRPPAGSVDVDALVNYFAGAAARAPRKSVALEVEASPAPVEVEGDRAILRFSVDTAKAEVAPRASVPPVARDARVEIDINESAVESFRRIGGDDALHPETALLHNMSVTGLYELELKPKLKSTQRVATVRLRYQSLVDGREHMITRVVHGHDLAKSWARASRRHRLASLGAVWSETLQGTTGGADVAKRAEELATQNPADARARELAKAANATTGGGR